MFEPLSAAVKSLAAQRQSISSYKYKDAIIYNSKLMALMMNKTAMKLNQPIIEFIGLKPKMYSFLVQDSHLLDEKTKTNKAKG